MRNLILYTLSSFFMSLGADVQKEKENSPDALLEPIVMHVAVQVDCEHYSVFYSEGEKFKTKKGKLIDFVRMGMDVNYIVLMSENTWSSRRAGRGFKTNYKIDLRPNYALIKDRDGNIYEVRYNELETFFLEDNI